ncbi:NINE protein [Candidatus Parabeggiatoa sp. HSG14]|uniref:NINE protein n=1 Tax=Candidatus Parabeggiatoa sp. HSG14 TaxID=3055593 RepID=UPI0025A8D330|nr:NINE protein [Thiotrichales bacterium HSG14]
MKTYYEILGINKNANTTEIKEAAKTKASEIKTIFWALSNANKRKTYDAELKQQQNPKVIGVQKKYYEILEITPNATPTEIKEAIQARLKEIKIAFGILSDAEKRKIYNLKLESIETNTSTIYTSPKISHLNHKKCCLACNVVVHQKAEICPQCGVRQRKPASKLTLLLLTLFFGSWGVHRFYLGNYVRGILYFLFFWTLIPTLISWMEYLFFIFIRREKIEENYEAHDSAVAIMIAIPIFIVSIFLGIAAVPFYSDYMNKFKVEEAVSLLDHFKTEANTLMADTGQFPHTEELKSLNTINLGKYTKSIVSNPPDFYLQVVMINDASAVAGKTIRFTYDPVYDLWKCSPGYPNAMDNKYLPRHCKT